MKCNQITCVIVAVAANVAAMSGASAQRTVTPQQKQAYIDQAKAGNQRQAAADAASNAHRQRLAADIAAARKSGNKTYLAKLEAMQAQDAQHLEREHARKAEQQQHIKNVYALKVRK